MLNKNLFSLLFTILQQFIFVLIIHILIIIYEVQNRNTFTWNNFGLVTKIKVQTSVLAVFKNKLDRPIDMFSSLPIL